MSMIEGTDTSQGIPQLISNINACCAIVDTVRTTLGPRGMDKLVYQSEREVTISNDGATVMRLLDIVHPAAKTLVDIARSQDSEVGDGTTSVVVMAGEFLKAAKPFIEEGIHPQIIIRAYRSACELAKQKIRDLSIVIKQENMREFLEKCAATAMNSKLIASHKEFFSKMVVDAVQLLDDSIELDMIGIKKESGGGMEDSIFIAGAAFKRTFFYAGFEQQPKHIVNPKILCLNHELELKAEKDNAEIRISDPSKYQALVNAEWKLFFDKLEAIHASGANVILSRLAIGDLATQYFADKKMFCAGRVPEDDLRRVCRATGAAIQTTVSNIIPEIIGHCGLFEEKQVGSSRYNLFTGATKTQTATIILRGGGDQFIDEAERSLHDSIMIVRRARKHSSVVAGGGSTEMELSKYLRDYSLGIEGKQQLLIGSYAKALEVIPRQISDNAGFDSTDILNQLRQKHSQPGGQWFGVDIANEGICDTYQSAVWEPTLVKLNSITAATEATCLILSVDETVSNQQQAEQQQAGPQIDPRTRQALGRGGAVRAMKGR
ncbi:chaperonin containing TCP1 eta subunit [Cavenderia fasciculata]|uniref:T-complex protein 1 subunit eta n=1 Tax=Cavenderia fasciculata TaxID=261658 RepID=F4Q6R0_CACFS|nr:chaperonin containing TCP1 eta subunit [Cavenderia fasciculata]EGG16570.1 chaperonin containing TCP1 eta subunit [Cavenderia fasciculata]|eukprot:XP_004354970.1 chaperonin containing TCP1 eta subunit [Cavenderia fasciculata]